MLTASELTADFGFAPQGSIGDTTYVDFNFDGSFDANGDDVLPNVKVELYAGACPADLTTLTNRLREVTSDANGAYTFTEVADGDYCVVAENPGAYEAQEGSIGHSVTVSGTAIVTADFGYTPLVSLGDYVYIDGNQNGAADDGEPAIAGADVTLYDGLCPAGLVIVATTQTDVNGAYLFEDLPSGDYCVEVTNTGAGAGIEGAGGQSVTLTTFDVLTADFGFTPAGAIGDQTYIDNNQDQNYDASVDQILAGVQVDYYAGECPADLGTLGASLGSQLTDANGLYLFDAVTDGIYCVVATNPGLSDALEGAFGQTVVVEGLEVRTADFGFAARGSIGNQTYVDANLDDTFDNLDTALPFVTVDLYAGSCPADLTTLVDRLRTTETDINGVYTFDQVPDGDYCVVAEVPGSYDPREGEFGQSVTVSGNAVDTADFGYAPWVSIGDFVYVDNDQSVSADAGEPAIAGAEVTLYDGLCAANGAVLATTLTDVNGYYAFDDLPPGDYCVEVTEHDAGTALQGAGGQSVVLGHTDILTIDFGFAPDGAIGDQTYIDSDQNGVYGLDDKIVSNVTVNLYAGDCPVDLSTLTGLIDTAQTDANGQYLFTQVPDGDYCVVAINPGSSIALEGVAGQEVTVAGGTELTADFGFAPTGSVGDLTYIDYDLDGVFGVGDEITPFVTIGLYPGLCPADLTTLPARLRTTNSDVNGLYLFAEVADGDYCVVADGPDGFQPIEGAAGQSVTVLGDAVLTADFGYAPLMTIGDFVYTDNNLDGSADAGDVPIPGATVTLEANACDAATRTVVATTQTDFNGLYSFDDLVPGEYCVSVINTAYGAAYEGAGEQSVTLVTTDRLDIDFGFAPAGSVGDMVYTDNERNGAYDPTDDALADATVELYAGDCPADLTTLDPTNLVATTTSDANGLYLFTEVPDGDYCVTATSANTGEAFEGKYGQEVEVQGGEELSADFGFGAVGTIGDFVYYDTNVDGAQDINEPGHDNISVLLYTGACPADLMQLAVPYDITISDVNGAYLFDQLPAGDYCVIANDGGIDTQLEGAGGHTVTVNQDDTTTADFGYVPRATIGDTVYADDNGTLLQDGTEPGLLGVPVQLFRGLCDAADPLPLDTFLTTIDGLYSFTDLPAGEYCVRATPGAVGTLTQGAGGQSVTLYGVDQLDADFGVQRSGDLRLIKEVSDLTETPIARGDQVIFDLRVFNESSIVTMTEIELTDFLPDGYTFISATDGGVHDGSLVGGNVVWTIDSIAPRMTQTVSVTLLVNETGSVNNEAEITSTRQPDTDSETGNRSQLPDEDDTSTFSLPTESVSDLVLTKTVLDPAPLLGEQATFELTVVNNGPSDTSNVTISDILPNGLAFVSASEPLSTTAIPMEYIWTIGDLAAGETQTLTMVVDTLASHTEKLDYTNIAEVATSDSRDPNATAGNMIDPNEDDEASSTVYPSAIALGKDLIAISDPASGAEGNFEATFELLVHNTGATELVNIELIDDLISQMGAGFVETLSVTISEPAAFAVDQGNVADSDALLNTAFLGTNPATEVIRSDANVSLAASDRFVITLIVEVSPDKAPDIDNDGIAGPITNVATISASVNPMGQFPTSVPIDVTDDSDDDHDLNGTSDSPNDTNTDPVDDPTGVPGVSLAKDLISAVQPAVVDGVEIVDSIAMTVEHTVTNIGGVPLRNLEFRENLLNSADQVVSIIDEGEIVFDMPLPGEWTADNLDDGYASVPDFRPFLGGASILGVGETLVFQTTIVAQLDPSLGGEFENISTIIAYADVDNDGSFETEISDTSDNNGLVDEETDRNTPDGNSSNDPTPLPSAESDKVILDSIVLLDATANVFRAKWGFRVTNTGEMDLVDVGIWDDFAAQNDTVVSVDAVNITLIDDTAAGSKWSVSQSNFLDDDWITTPLSADMVEFGDGNGNILEPGGTLYFEAEVDFTMGEIDGLTTVTNQARLGGNGDEDGDGNADDGNNDGVSDFVVIDPTPKFGEPVEGSEASSGTVGTATISAQKALVGVQIDEATGYSVLDFDLRVINTGDYALTDLSILEDMAGQFGDDGFGNYVYRGLVEAPYISSISVDDAGYTQINLDPNFDGGLDGNDDRSVFIDVLTVDSQLAVGGEVIIRVSAYADFSRSYLSDTFTNQYTVNGYVDQNGDGNADDTDNNGVNDTQVTDTSDNGFNREDEDEDTDIDDTKDNDPTGLPAMTATKTLYDIEYPYTTPGSEDDGDAEIRLVFDFVITNTGTTRLHDVRIADTFVDQPMVEEVTSATVVSMTPSNPDLWKATDLAPEFATVGAPTIFQTADGNQQGVATLDAGDTVTVRIELIATLDPQEDVGISNSAQVYGSVDLTDDGDGNDPGDGVIGVPTDGDGNRDDDDDGNGNPTDDPTRLPLIAVTKVLRDNTLTQTASRSFQAVFDFEIHNVGSAELTDIQFLDDFMAQNNAEEVRIESIDGVSVEDLLYFPAVETTLFFTADTLESTFMTPSPAVLTPFTGGQNNLAPGESITFAARVDFTMVQGYEYVGDGPSLSNLATVQGTSVDDPNRKVTDTGGPIISRNESTPVGLPVLRLEKDLIDIQPSTDAPTTELTFQLRITNLGASPLTELTLIEDLETQLGGVYPDGGFVGLVSEPEWIDFLNRSVADGYTEVYIDPTFDGTAANSNILLPSSKIEAGTYITIELVVEVAHDNPNLPAGFSNSAEATGYSDEDRDGVADSGSVIVRDTSDDNYDDDATDDTSVDGGDGDPSNDPTGLPGLQTTKTLSQPFVPSGDDGDTTTFAGEFQFAISNTGTLDLENLTFVDHFLDNLGVVSIDDVAVSAIASTVTDSAFVGATLDPAFITGPASVYFDNGGTKPILVPGETITFRVFVEFTYDEDAQEDGLTNSATTMASIDLNDDGDPTNDGAMIIDESDGDGDPTDDSDGNGDPGDDPTNVLGSTLGLAKSFVVDEDTGLGGYSYAADPSYFVFTIRLDVENTGDLPLTDVLLVDAEPATWGADVFTVAQPTVLVPASEGSTINLRNDYDALGGQTALTAAGTRLQPGETFAVQFALAIDLDDPDLSYPLDENYGNQAIVYGSIDLPDETGYGDGIADEFDTNGDGVVDGPVIVTDRSDSGIDPAGSNPGEPGDTGGTNDTTPLPNPLPPEFRVIKRAAKGSVSRGDNAQWTITVENTGPISGLGIQVVDVLPTGLVYVQGSGQIDGVTNEPTVTASGTYPGAENGTVVGVNGTAVTGTGQVLTWTVDDLGAGETRTVTFFTQVSVGATPGQTLVNNAYTYDPKWPEDRAIVSNVAEGELLIAADAVFDCSTVIGQVFNDLNGDGYQDRDEPGVATQRIVALVDGTAKTIRTDSKGRYHVPCASLPDQDIGSNIVLKLDERRAPSGFRITTENPRVVRLTAGKMTKVNFGVQIARVVELSLNGCAFEGSSTELTDASKDGMRALMSTLEAGRSTLRLTYRQQDEGNPLVQRRTNSLSKMVKALWRDTNSTYKLDIELARIRVIGQGPLDCKAPAYVPPRPAPQQKVEVIETITVEPAVQQQVQRVQQVQTQYVQQVQPQYVQQYAQQQYVLQGYVTQEQLQQGYQSGLVQFNENGQAITNSGYDLNALNAGSVSQSYGGGITGYTSGGTATAAYGVTSGAAYGGTSNAAARAGAAVSGSNAYGAGSSVSGSANPDPLTEETLRLLESAKFGQQTGASAGEVDPLSGW